MHEIKDLLMVKCLKVKKEFGEELISKLKKQGKFAKNIKLGKTGRFLLIPIQKKIDEHLIKKYNAVLVERNLEKIKDTSPKTFREALQGVLKKDEIEKVNSSYDIIGDIAVIDFDDSLKKVETTIAWTLKRTNKNIKVVAKRSKKTLGKFRIRKVMPIVGEKRTETIHKENNIRLKIDLNKAYYSVRYSSERLRLLKQIKNNEKILVMFAGVGPFPILFAKKKNVQVWANELNPDAVRFLKENIKLNKLNKKVKIVEGDAHEVILKIRKKFDRIIMPLPHSAKDFLKEALSVSKKGTIIHIYQFEHEEKVEEMKKEIVEECKKYGRKIKIINIFKTGYFAPRINRYCLDIKVM